MWYWTGGPLVLDPRTGNGRSTTVDTQGIRPYALCVPEGEYVDACAALKELHSTTRHLG
jgi:hypothetical protein